MKSTSSFNNSSSNILQKANQGLGKMIKAQAIYYFLVSIGAHYEGTIEALMLEPPGCILRSHAKHTKLEAQLAALLEILPVILLEALPEVQLEILPEVQPEPEIAESNQHTSTEEATVHQHLICDDLPTSHEDTSENKVLLGSFVPKKSQIMSAPFYVDAITSHAMLTDEQWIKAVLRYALIEEVETCKMLEEATLHNWKKFVAAVKLLYPGCEEQVCVPMTSQEELGQYYCKFFKILRHLIMKKKLTKLGWDCLFLNRFHVTAKTAIMWWLKIKLTNHHPDNPYDIMEVYNAAVFFLLSMSPASAPKNGYASLTWSPA
ncbi:hypothetical protein BDR04DRAFT_1123713 [Suillus decipiens]|nr:hypothetical protein BDR04DRAFT_1123713 [Suillus decipiens]